MAYTARCPSCGAPVNFRSAASVLAVCDFCQSTLLRRGGDIENLGKMAELLADRSPLQRGAEGRWQGRHFGLIGRIQLRYEQGVWNEWFLLFDDGKTGWLFESGGEYVISEPKGIARDVPAFEQLGVDSSHLIDGRSFTVTNVLTAECVAGEGELPFKVGAGYPAPVADLRDEQGRLATFDYSDDPERPLLFVGESVAFASLQWANLRHIDRAAELAAAPTVEARAFNCPNCGAPLKIAHENIETIGCPSCAALLDPGDERVKLLAKAKEALSVKPLLPLGSKGTLRGEALEIIGFMRRSTRLEGVTYPWSEYVALGKDNRLVWLTESDGHWNVASVLPKALKASGGSVRYEQQEFKHFQRYVARVDYVIGEFPWKVRFDETVKVDDYVAPPRMLSKEVSVKEQTWTLGEYLSPEELQTAFGVKARLPKPKGVYANQPNPHEESHRRTCRRFWQFAAVALAVHFLLLFLGTGGKPIEEKFILLPTDEEPKLSQEFTLTGASNRVELQHQTSLTNNWVGLNAVLINKDTGENWQAARELSYYAGVDEGESWTEGSASSEVLFTDLPAGHYVLAMDAELEDNSVPVVDWVTIAHPGPRWSSLVLVLIFLMIFPIYTRMRHHGFEVRRWAESDHPMVTSGDSGDDD